MDAKCLTCKHWLPKESGAMAAHGYAICGLGPKWRFKSLFTGCGRWSPAPVAASRVKWAQRFMG